MLYTAFPDPTRAKQANTVQTDFKAVDLDAAAAAAPALLSAQLDAMHAEQDRFSQIQTQAAISTFVDAPLEGQVPTRAGPVHLGLKTRAMQQLQRLALTPTGASLADAQKLVSQFGDYRSKMVARDDYFRTAGQSTYARYHLGSAPSCDDVPGTAAGVYSQNIADALGAITSANDRATAKQLLENIRANVCAPIKAPEVDSVYAGAGQIAVAHERLLKAKARRVNEAALADAQMRTVEKAQDEYNAAVAKSGSTTPNADSVKAEADKLVQALQALQGLSAKTGGRSDKLLAGLNLSAANSQLGDISEGVDGTQLPEGTKNPAALIILATRLLDDKVKFDTALVRSQEVPPQLVLAQETLQLQQAQATVTAQDQRIKLLQQLEDTLWDEYVHLVDSQTQLGLAQAEASKVAQSGPWAKVVPSDAADCNPADKIPLEAAKQTYEQMFCVNPPVVREAMLLSAVYYVAAEGRLEAKRRKLEYDLIDVDDQLSVTYSAINLQRWNALLAPTVNEVVVFNTLDSNTVSVAAQILQVLGLAYIGHGVNK